jgi:hypothetical protein
MIIIKYDYGMDWDSPSPFFAFWLLKLSTNVKKQRFLKKR